MSYSVCTLFEGHFHYGVAALSNSLYRRGFRGAIYAGYRGPLPEWAGTAQETTAFMWDGSKTFKVADGLQIHFLPLQTDYQFSFYKPEFMLTLLAGPAKDSEGLAYFDPDIVIKCEWNFFEHWMNWGIALVHDETFNDMPATHPIRRGWGKLIKNSNRKIESNINSYINAGFCGLNKTHVEFLKIWSEFIELAFSDYGHQRNKFVGLEKSNLFFYCDQNALNIAAMCSPMISEIGPEGMDFIGGGRTMSHATGNPKPWNKNFIASALKGIPPTQPERNYWRNALRPIAPYKKSRLKFKRRCIKIAALIGRFYRRS